jgi:hypothetical protein
MLFTIVATPVRCGWCEAGSDGYSEAGWKSVAPSDVCAFIFYASDNAFGSSNLPRYQPNIQECLRGFYEIQLTRSIALFHAKTELAALCMKSAVI